MSSETEDEPPVSGHALAVVGRAPLRPLVALAITIVVGNVLVVSPWTPLNVAGGVWLLIALPTLLLFSKVPWPDRGLLALLLSIAGSLLLLVIPALVMNYVLPLAGIDRPLSKVPLLVVANVVAVALTAWRRDATPGLPRGGRIPLSGGERWLAALSAIVLVLSIAGPTRLNNGLSGNVTLVMLALVLVLLVLLVVLAARVREIVVISCIYTAGVALLLMTSLRGWFITGHDIQFEYQMFTYTNAAGAWNVTSFRNAYNACLSITILPTVIENITGLPGLYIFKVLAQLLFALCPIVVYLIGRRFLGRKMSVLGATFFMIFPTYYNDMPFLVRQEVALFFVGLLVAVAVQVDWPLWLRRATITCLSIASVLSHYSTTYVLILIMLGALCVRMVGLRLPVGRRNDSRVQNALGGRFGFGLLEVAVLAAAAYLWAGPVTHTGGQVRESLSATVAQLTGSPADRSADTSYALWSAARPSNDELLAEYEEESLSGTAAERAQGQYLPLDVLSAYPVTKAPEEVVPVSPVGRLIQDRGVDLYTVSYTVKRSAAAGFQVLILLGLVMAWRRRSSGGNDQGAVYGLAVGGAATVAVIAVLPALSVEYGVFRALQQALLVLAPVMALGVTQLCSLLGRRAGAVLPAALLIGLLPALSGASSQVLGGFSPQLYLNNSGLYYNIYYVNAREIAGTEWLRREAEKSARDNVQVDISSDRYTINRVRSVLPLPKATDIFPPLVRTDALVFLGTPTMEKGISTINFKGSLITYRYPLGLLDREKDLLYANGGAEVYG
ncbi:hypothetical protein [Kineococcus radiotolerans]|uniref:Membrane protein-like n=1 Tax=Kineococcus radiotolerans (strain ATCC BAA-149 / DSM 14245 / SRS30216) TaxID=266940 RepID=A6W6V8_KINRD|nr:hypothetical protein [Kineococcus radiotolerans]ABS02547.1 membrane protein-like [Kineococcus radiotolerans SRS30216 = ATCC BAA-149]